MRRQLVAASALAVVGLAGASPPDGHDAEGAGRAEPPSAAGPPAQEVAYWHRRAVRRLHGWDQANRKVTRLRLALKGLRSGSRGRRGSTSPTAAGFASATASWYGPGLYGNGLACGGRLEPGWTGVAHKTLACGTKLTICYGRRCAPSFVGDRGPFVAGREFDLGPGLAQALGFAGVGTIRWRTR